MVESIRPGAAPAGGVGRRALVTRAFRPEGLLGAWWIDGVTALALVYVLVKEGREAWQGEECCDAETP